MNEGMLEVRLENDHLVSGQPFGGIVVISLGDKWEVRHAGVVLRWVAGTPDHETSTDAVWQELAERETQMNPMVAIPFEMVAPVMPWTFTGRQFRVSWMIGALVKPRGGLQLDVWRTVHIHPPGGNWSPPPLSSTQVPML